MTAEEERKALASVFLCGAARNYVDVGDLDENDPDLLKAREELHNAAIAFAQLADGDDRNGRASTEVAV